MSGYVGGYCMKNEGGYCRVLHTHTYFINAGWRYESPYMSINSSPTYTHRLRTKSTEWGYKFSLISATWESAEGVTLAIVTNKCLCMSLTRTLNLWIKKIEVHPVESIACQLLLIFKCYSNTTNQFYVIYERLVAWTLSRFMWIRIMRLFSLYIRSQWMKLNVRNLVNKNNHRKFKCVYLTSQIALII